MTNSTRAERITNVLNEKLQPTTLTIRDDSAQHSSHGNVPAGATETHLHITIKADALNGKSRIEQHKAVLSLLNKEFDSGLHALQIEVA